MSSKSSTRRLVDSEPMSQRSVQSAQLPTPSRHGLLPTGKSSSLRQRASRYSTVRSTENSVQDPDPQSPQVITPARSPLRRLTTAENRQVSQPTRPDPSQSVATRSQLLFDKDKETDSQAGHDPAYSKCGRKDLPQRLKELLNTFLPFVASHLFRISMFPSLWEVVRIKEASIAYTGEKFADISDADKKFISERVSKLHSALIAHKFILLINRFRFTAN